MAPFATVASSPSAATETSFHRETIFALARSLAKIPDVGWNEVERALFVHCPKIGEDNQVICTYVWICSYSAFTLTCLRKSGFEFSPPQPLMFPILMPGCPVREVSRCRHRPRHLLPRLRLLCALRRPRGALPARRREGALLGRHPAAAQRQRRQKG